MKFTPRPNRVLVLPRKEVKLTKSWVVPDEEKNKDKGPNDVREVKTVKQKVPANCQIGVVLASGINGIVPGDVVVYRRVNLFEFDLIKKTLLLDDYQVVGFWNENEELENVIV